MAMAGRGCVQMWECVAVMGMRGREGGLGTGTDEQGDGEAGD
jgi:hypothetical protein